MGGTSHKSTMHTGAIEFKNTVQWSTVGIYQYFQVCLQLCFVYVLDYSIFGPESLILDHTTYPYIIRRLYNIRCNDENVDDNADVEYDDNNSPNDN